jgi:phage virion morphogenesis protein
MSGIEINIDGLIPATRRLNSLRLTGIKKRRELTKLCRKVISNSKRRVRNQTDLDGSPYEKRWKKRKDRRKMLAGLAQRLKVIRNDGSNGVIGLAGASARIAAAQQYGQVLSVTALSDNAAISRNSRASDDDPATRKQAKNLRDLGFKVKGKKPLISWVVGNLKVKQAAAIIKYLRLKQGITAQTNWTTVLPARSFLGATSAEVEELIDILINDITDVI